MNVWSRPLATLAAAAVGGIGLWLAGHWDTQGNGGYWAMLGVLAGAGLLIGLAQLRSPDGNAPGMFLVAWLPIAITAGWVLVFAQPDPNGPRDSVREWSGDLGIADVAHYVAPFVAVLAFTIGLVTGLTLLAGYVMRRERLTVVEDTTAAPARSYDRDVAAEPAGRGVVYEPATRNGVVDEPVTRRDVVDEPAPRQDVVEQPVAADSAETVRRDSVQRETVPPEAARTETVPPERVQNEAVQPEPVQSEPVTSDTVQREETVQPAGGRRRVFSLRR